MNIPDPSVLPPDAPDPATAPPDGASARPQRPDRTDTPPGDATLEAPQVLPDPAEHEEACAAPTAGMPATPAPTLEGAHGGPDAVPDPAATPGRHAAPAGPGPAAVAAELATCFPAVFSPGRPRPLKLRIQADIQARMPGHFSRKLLGVVLQRHTTSTGYLKALATQPDRIDLDGQPAGPVDPAHREAAAAELERRRSLRPARPAGRPPAAGPRPAAGRGRPEATTPAPEGDGRSGPAPSRPARPPAEPRDRPRPGRRPAAEGTAAPSGAAPRRPPPPSAPRAEGGAPPPARDRRVRERPPEPRGPRPGPREPRPDPAAARPALEPAQAERAALLRAFETSSLSRANFCALKRLTEPELDSLLAQARAERERRGRPA